MTLISEKRILWPEGEADRITPEFGEFISFLVWNALTIVDMPGLTGDTELSIVIDRECPDGATLIINIDQDATARDVAFGNGLVSDDLVGVANDKDTLTFVYNKPKGEFRLTSNQKTVSTS
ncbi:MAG: hypothetical protein AAGA66_08365 [Bacteroidota bacterium]